MGIGACVLFVGQSNTFAFSSRSRRLRTTRKTTVFDEQVPKLTPHLNRYDSWKTGKHLLYFDKDTVFHRIHV